MTIDRRDGGNDMVQVCRVCGFRGSVDAMERHGSIAHRELILGCPWCDDYQGAHKPEDICFTRGNESGESVANVLGE